MSVVVVMVKKQTRIDQPGSHSYKYQGGVLNTSASRGRGYYVRRINGQDRGVLFTRLSEIVHSKV